MFPTERFVDRLARALAEARAISLKELLEAFEFFERVRHRIRSRNMVDVCCGHGLAGLLFAVFERSVEHVTLIDHRSGAAFERVRAAIEPLAPWIRGRVEYTQLDLQEFGPSHTRDASVIALHACGGRTDECIDVAVASRSALAVMPCCHRKSTPRAPATLRRALGVQVASDVHRTYRLIDAGYRVDWTTIPDAITPRNRIVVATPQQIPLLRPK